MRLLCAGIIDTLLHSFQCRVKHLFVGHIAHGLVVHLHLQSVGLADGGLEHGHHNSQRCHRQHIHSHAGHKADVISDAMGKKVAACAQRSAKAVFLAYPVCVAQQRPGAPGKAMDAIFFSSSLTVCSRHRSPCCKRRPVRTTAYSAEKPMAYSVSPTIGAMGLCSSLCHSFSQRC